MRKAIEVTQTVDYETGEVKSQSVTRRYRGDEPSYIKVYLQDISYLHGLPTTAGDLMHELLNYVTYGTQEIVLTSVIKKCIAGNLSIAMKTLDNRLQDLVKKGIIDRVGQGTFTLNPYLFGKGDWKTILELRNNNIHLEIIYDKDTGERKVRGELDVSK